MNNDELKLGLQIRLEQREKYKSYLTQELAKVEADITALKTTINVLETDNIAQAVSQSIAKPSIRSQEETSFSNNSLRSASRTPRNMLRESYKNLSYIDATIRYFGENPTLGSLSIEELIKALFVWQTPEELARIRASYTAEIRRRGVDDEEGRLEVDPQTKGKRPQRYRLRQQEANPNNNRE